MPQQRGPRKGRTIQGTACTPVSSYEAQTFLGQSVVAAQQDTTSTRLAEACTLYDLPSDARHICLITQKLARHSPHKPLLETSMRSTKRDVVTPVHSPTEIETKLPCLHFGSTDTALDVGNAHKVKPTIVRQLMRLQSSISSVRPPPPATTSVCFSSAGFSRVENKFPVLCRVTVPIFATLAPRSWSISKHNDVASG